MAENYNRGNVVVNRRSFVKGAFGAGMLGMLSLAGLTGCAPKSEQSSDIDGGTFDIVVIGAGGAGIAAARSRAKRSAARRVSGFPARMNSAKDFPSSRLP